MGRGGVKVGVGVKVGPPGAIVDLAEAKHGRSIFTYLCPKTGKEFDVLGTMPDVPPAKAFSDRFEIGRNFCNKLWNAARFALMNLGEHGYAPLEVKGLAFEDRWILLRLSKIVGEVTRHLKAFNPSAAIGAARDLFWRELCDWYLELIKPRMNEGGETALTARTVLAVALDTVLRLLHPSIPFITEAIWERLNARVPVRGIERPLETNGLLIVSPWPQVQPDWEDEEVETEFSEMQEVIRAIRDVRTKYTVPPAKKLQVRIKADEEAAASLSAVRGHVLKLAGLDKFDVSVDQQCPALAATRVAAGLEVHVIGAVDLENEKARLEKQKQGIKKQLMAAQEKLANGNFLSKAAPEVVEGVRRKRADLESQLDLIENALNSF